MLLADKVVQAPWYKKIEVLRALKGWTQVETAEHCGVQEKIYWNWENGVSIPVKRNRKAISKAFDIPEDEIFSDVYRAKG